MIEAGDYSEAIEQFRQNPVEILVTDIFMPGPGNGCELAVQLLKLKPDLKVLFVSGYVGFEICRLYGMALTDVHLLRKPFTAEAFLARLQEAVESTEPLPDISGSHWRAAKHRQAGESGGEM